MKRILCLLIAALLLTGCSGSGKPQQDSALSISQAVQDSQNIELAENFRLNAPEVPLYTFQRTYYERQKSDIAYADYQRLYSYIYPDAPFEEDAVYFVGERYHSMLEAWDKDYAEWQKWQGQQIKNGTWNPDTPDYTDEHPAPDPPGLLSYRDTILSGTESVQYFCYDYYRSTPKHEPKFLGISSPAGSDLFRFNRGGFVRQFFDDDVPFLETVTPEQFAAYEGTYLPDSQEVFPLSDGDCAIRDAVQVFEKYVNSIPLSDEPVANLAVMRVNVLKTESGSNLFHFVCTSKYKDIPFDYRDLSGYSGESSTQGETGVTLTVSGCMTEGRNVESLDGLPRIWNITDEKPVAERISAARAVQIVSENLSANVPFLLQSAELVYTAAQPEEKELASEISLDTKPAWKLTLYNTNDQRYYVCYADAADGRNFRYYAYAEVSK